MNDLGDLRRRRAAEGDDLLHQAPRVLELGRGERPQLRAERRVGNARHRARGHRVGHGAAETAAGAPRLGAPRPSPRRGAPCRLSSPSARPTRRAHRGCARRPRPSPHDPQGSPDRGPRRSAMRLSPAASAATMNTVESTNRRTVHQAPSGAPKASTVFGRTASRNATQNTFASRCDRDDSLILPTREVRPSRNRRSSPSTIGNANSAAMTQTPLPPLRSLLNRTMTLMPSVRRARRSDRLAPPSLEKGRDGDSTEPGRFDSPPRHDNHHGEPDHQQQEHRERNEPLGHHLRPLLNLLKLAVPPETARQTELSDQAAHSRSVVATYPPPAHVVRGRKKPRRPSLPWGARRGRRGGAPTATPPCSSPRSSPRRAL